MNLLIVEDDFTSRLLLQELLKPYGLAHVAANGREAVQAVRQSMESSQPYDLICMDIMMPDMDGQEALREIRAMEEANGVTFSHGAKIVMISALTDMRSKISAFSGLCNGYIDKPIRKDKLLEELRSLGLVS